MIAQTIPFLRPELELDLIQPVDELGQPISLPEIARRIRDLDYRCDKCNALLGMRCYLEAQPNWRPGVLVPPHPFKYKVLVPCVLCGKIHELSQLIRAHQGGDQ